MAAVRSVKWPAARRTLYSSLRAAYSRTRTTRSSSWNQAKRRSTLGWSSPCWISISRRKCAWKRYFSSLALYITLSATTYPLCIIATRRSASSEAKFWGRGGGIWENRWVMLPRTNLLLAGEVDLAELSLADVLADLEVRHAPLLTRRHRTREWRPREGGEVR